MYQRLQKIENFNNDSRNRDFKGNHRSEPPINFALLQNINQASYGPQNKVLDYSKLQGVINPSDLNQRPPRDINSRYITIENSSNRSIGVGIETFLTREIYLPPVLPTPELSPPQQTTIATVNANVDATANPTKINATISIKKEPELRPRIDFIIRPHEIKYLGVNTNDAPGQFIYIIDITSGVIVGPPQFIERTVNQFVLREGINSWWVQKFHKTS